MLDDEDELGSDEEDMPDAYYKLSATVVVGPVGEVFAELGYRSTADADDANDVAALRVTRWQLKVQDTEAVKLYDSQMDIKVHQTRMVKLRPDALFTAKVRLWSDKAQLWGPWCSAVRIRTMREVRCTPNDIGEDYVRLSWDRPPRAVDQPAPLNVPPRLSQLQSISSFQVRVLEEATMWQEFEQEFEVGVRSYTLYGLQPGKRYIVMTRYLNLIGNLKAWQEQFRFVTVSPLELSVAQRGENFLALSWTRPGSALPPPSGPRPSSSARERPPSTTPGPRPSSARPGSAAPAAAGAATPTAVPPSGTKYETNAGRTLKYQVMIKGGGINGEEEDPVLVPPSQTTYTIEDLIPGATYEVAVRSLDEAGRWGLWSPTVTVATVERIHVTVETLSEGFTTFTWQRGEGPETTEEPDQSYRLHVLGVDHPYEYDHTLPADGTAQNRVCRLNDLKPGLVYKIFVRGYLTNHWGLWSAPAEIKSLDPLLPKCSNRGEDFLEITWRPNALRADLPDSLVPRRYQICVNAWETPKREGAVVWDKEFEAPDVVEQKLVRTKVEGLIPAVKYRVRVRAQFQDMTFKQWGEWSPPHDVSTLRAVGIQLADVGEDFVHLNWSRAVMVDSSSVKGKQEPWYDLKYELMLSNETTGEEGVVHKEVLETSFQVTQLSPCTTYSVSVRACDENEVWGLWQKAYFQTLGSITVTAHEIGEEFVRLMWQRVDVGKCPSVPKDATVLIGEKFVSSYQIQAYTAPDDGTGTAQVLRKHLVSEVELDSFHTSHRLEGLNPDVLYNVRVRACTATGAWGQWSDNVLFRTVKAFSIPLKNLAVGENYVAFNWEQARQKAEKDVLQGDDTITGQQVRIRELEGSDVIERTLEPFERFIKVCGLKPATAYGLSIRKCNANGEWGPWTEEICILTGASMQTRAVEIAENYVVVEWYKPVVPNPHGYLVGQNAITTYHLRVSGDNGYNEDMLLQESDCPYLIPDLQADRLFEITVRGHYNEDEWGAWSSQLQCLTLPRLQVSCELIGEDFARLSWARPASTNRRFARLQAESQGGCSEYTLQKGSTRPVYEVRVTTRMNPPEVGNTVGLAAWQPVTMHDAPDDDEIDENNAHGGECPNLVLRKETENKEEVATDIVQGLHPNLVYTVSVRSAVAPGRWGLWSNHHKFVTLGSMITSFDAIGEDYTSISWARAPCSTTDAGISRGVGTISQSQVRVLDLTAIGKPQIYTIDSDQTTFIVPDLMPFRNYEVGVRSYHDGAAWGVWGGPFKVRTQVGIGINIEHTGEDFVHISWFRKPDTVDAGLTADTWIAIDDDFERYAVQIKGEDGFLFEGQYEAADKAGHAFHYKGLLPDTRYEIALRIKDSFGNWGFWCKESFVTPNRLQLSFGNVGEQFVVAKWDRLSNLSSDADLAPVPRHAGTAVRLQVQEWGTSTYIVYDVDYCDEFQIPDLKPDTCYLVAVAVATGTEQCWGLWSVPQKVRTLPQLLLSIEDIGEAYVGVAWVREHWPPAIPTLVDGTPDPKSGHIPVTEADMDTDAHVNAHGSTGQLAGYQVRVMRADGTVVVEDALSPGSTSTKLEGLQADQHYKVSVRGQDVFGEWGLWSTEHHFLTLKPVVVNLVTVGEDCIDVKWCRDPVHARRASTSTPDERPVDPEVVIVLGDQAVRRWKLRVYGHKISWSDNQFEYEFEADTTHHRITGLIPNATYTITVMALSASGEWGFWSEIFKIKTLDLLLTDIPYIAEDFAHVTWQRSMEELPVAPHYSIFHEVQPLYHLRATLYEDDGIGGLQAVGEPQEFETLETTYSVGGLAPGQRYKFEVRQKNREKEWGQWSRRKYVCTLEGMTVTAATIGEDFVTPSWSRHPTNVTPNPEQVLSTACITQYQLDIEELDEMGEPPADSGKRFRLNRYFDAADVSFEVFGLKPNVIYGMKVRAQTDGQYWGLWSALQPVITMRQMEVSIDLINEHNVNLHWTRYQPNWLMSPADRMHFPADLPCPAHAAQIETGDYRIQNVQLLVEEITPGGEFKSLQVFPTDTTGTTVYGLQPDRRYSITVRSQNVNDVWSLWAHKVTMTTLKEVDCTFGKTAEDFVWLHWTRPQQEAAAYTEEMAQLYKATMGQDPPTEEDLKKKKMAVLYEESELWLDPQEVIIGHGQVNAWHVRVWGQAGAPTVSDLSLLLTPDDGDMEPPPNTQLPGQRLLFDAKFHSATEFKLRNLEPNACYTVAIRSRNKIGAWSAWVAPKTVRTLKQLQMQQCGIAENYVKLAWYRDPPDADIKDRDEAELAGLRAKGRGGVYVHDGTCVESYLIQATQEDGTVREISLNAEDFEATRYTVEDLLCNERYKLQLCACYGDEEYGPWCESPLQLVTMNLLQLTVSYIGEDFISVDWIRLANSQAPEQGVIMKESTQGRGHKYELSLVTEDGTGAPDDQPLREIQINDETGFRVTRLQPDTVYCLAIREHHSDAAQWGSWCGNFQVQTLARMATQITEVQEDWVQVCWARCPAFQMKSTVEMVSKEAVVTGYRLRVHELREVARGKRQTVAEAGVQVVRQVQPDGTPFPIEEAPPSGLNDTDAPPAVDMEEQASAGSPASERPSAGEATADGASPPALPQPPRSKSATPPPRAPTPPSGAARPFSRPVEPEGELIYVEGADLYNTEVQLPASETSVRVEGLKPDKFYCVQVQAETAGGEWGLWSLDCYVLTMDTIKVKVPLIAEDRLTFTWCRPPPRYHHALKGVHVADLTLVEYQLAVEGVAHSYKFDKTFAPGVQEFTLTDLNRDTVYAVMIRSKDKMERLSLYSSRIEVVTPKALRVWPGKITEHFMEANWQRDPQDPADYPNTAGVPLLFSSNLVAEYWLTTKVVHTDKTIYDVKLAGNQKHFVVNALQPNVQYSVTVNARVDGCDWGLWAAPSVFVSMPRLDLCADTLGEDYVRLKWWRDMPGFYELTEKERMAALVAAGAAPADGALPRVYCTPDTKIDKFAVTVSNHEREWLLELDNHEENNNGVCEFVIPDLWPDTRYLITVRPCYHDGDWGMASLPVSTGTLNVLKIDIASCGEDHLALTWARSANSWMAAQKNGDPERITKYQLKIYDVTDSEEYRLARDGKPPRRRRLMLNRPVKKGSGTLFREVWTTDTQHLVEELVPNRVYSLNVRHWYVPPQDEDSVPAASTTAEPEESGEEENSAPVPEDLDPCAKHGIWGDEMLSQTMQPMYIRGADFGEDFIKLSWSRSAVGQEPANTAAGQQVIRQFQVRMFEMTADGSALSEEPGAFKLDRTFAPDTFHYVVQGLKPERLYSVECRACAGKDHRWGKWSTPVKMLSLPMLEMKIVQMGEDCCHFAWGRAIPEPLKEQGLQLPPTDTVVKYHLEVTGLEGKFSIVKKFRATRTSCTIRGLEASHVYKVQVRSYHENNMWSMWSTRVNFVTLKPMSLTFEKIAEEFMSLSWGREPQERAEYAQHVPEGSLDSLVLGNPDISKFHLCMYDAKNMKADSLIDTQFAPEVTTYEAIELQPQSPYTFLFRSANVDGEWSGWSAEIVRTTLPPFVIDISSIGDNYTSFTWSRPGVELVAPLPVLKYNVALTSEGGWKYDEVLQPDQVDTLGRITIRNLRADTPYTVSISAAYGEERWGMWSHPCNFATLNRLGLTVTNTELRTAVLAWGRGQQSPHQEANPSIVVWKDTPRNYKVDVQLIEYPAQPSLILLEDGSPQGGFPPSEFNEEKDFTVEQATEAEYKWTVENLSLACRFVARVCCQDSVGEWGDWSELVFESPPYAPGRPVMRQYDKQITGFSWDPPDTFVKYKYQVEMGVIEVPKAAKGKKGKKPEKPPSQDGPEVEKINWKELEITEVNACATKNGKDPLPRLRWRVRCCRLNREMDLWSDWSQVATFVDTAPPDPPVNITIAQLTKNFAQVEWERPVNIKNHPNSVFKVYLAEREGPLNLVAVTRDTVHKLEKLKPATPYRVCVHTESETGVSQKNPVMRFGTKTEGGEAFTAATMDAAHDNFTLPPPGGAAAGKGGKADKPAKGAKGGKKGGKGAKGKAAPPPPPPPPPEPEPKPEEPAPDAADGLTPGPPGSPKPAGPRPGMMPAINLTGMIFSPRPPTAGGTPRPLEPRPPAEGSASRPLPSIGPAPAGPRPLPEPLKSQVPELPAIGNGSVTMQPQEGDAAAAGTADTSPADAPTGADGEAPPDGAAPAAAPAAATQ